MNKLKVELYDDEIFLQPWFIPKNLYVMLRKLLPTCQLQRFRYYFDDYGCMRCGRRNVRYGQNGFCKGCGVIVRMRLIRTLKRRFRKLGTPVAKEPINQLLAALETAHLLRPEEIARRARGIRRYSK